VLDDAGPDSANQGPRPLALPLHIAWIPGHYAEEVLEQLARRIRDFLIREGITL
jgi:hypothetical protein